jgi:molecular chaperone DnaK (HSP70)
MGIAYGIDFGTSNSSIMIARDDGSVAKVPEPGGTHGSFAIPTAVCLLPDGKLEVGSAAERRKSQYPENYRREFKRDFGSRQPAVLGDRHMLPDELVTEVLRYLRKLAVKAVAGKPDQVVITVPVSWEQGNHELMLRAAKRAGLPRSRVTLLPEPVAAAGDAFKEAPGGVGTILVYDLGGGTFDCAVARRVADGSFEVLGAPGGLDTVGGAEFDRLILGRIREAYPRQCQALLEGPPADTDALRARLTLRDLCEQMKIKLSVRDEQTVELDMLAPGATFTLSRLELQKLIEPLLEETLDECERVLAAQGMSWSDVDRVVPVGGSSRLPVVRELIARRTGAVVLNVDRPDLAVVHGAVLRAYALAHPPAEEVDEDDDEDDDEPVSTYTPSSTYTPTYSSSSYSSSSSSNDRFKDMLIGAGIGAAIGAAIGAIFLGVGALPGIIIGAIIGGYKAYNA